MSIRVIGALGWPDPVQPRLHVAALPYPSARSLSIALSGPVLAPRVLRPVQGKAIPHQPFTEIRAADGARGNSAPIAIKADWIAVNRPARDEGVEIVGSLRRIDTDRYPP